MKSDWLRKLKKQLEDGGIEVTEEVSLFISQYINDPKNEHLKFEDIRFRLQDNTTGQTIFSTFDKDKREMITITSRGDSWIISTYYVDMDIIDTLNEIQINQTKNAVECYGEFT